VASHASKVIRPILQKESAEAGAWSRGGRHFAFHAKCEFRRRPQAKRCRFHHPRLIAAKRLAGSGEPGKRDGSEVFAMKIRRERIIRNKGFTGRLKFYAAGLRRCYRFLPYDEICQSVALGLMQSKRRIDDKKMAAKAVYRTAYNLGWHRVRDPETKRIVWASETAWICSKRRMKALPVIAHF
jgi:hypothetical protein